MNSVTDNNIDFKNFSANVNWRHQFDSTGRELTADVDYIAYDRHADMMLETVPFDKFGQVGGKMMLRGDLPSSIKIASFKSDYVHPFKDGKLEAGVKASYVENSHLVVYNKKIDDQWHHDNRSNHFDYTENITAGYVNLNKQFGKWSLQGGLRAERTKATGYQRVTSDKFDRDTTNLFPTAFVSYAVNKTNNLTVSYSKRIRRPDYQMLNPFIFFADSLVFQKGNPKLRPQYTHNIELSHSFKSKYITTLAYNTTDDVIAQIVKPEGIKMFNTFDNVAQLKNISLSLTIPVKVSKWWNANLFTTVYNNHYKGFYNAEPIDVNTTSFMANLTNTFTVSKGFTAELSGFYRHRGVDDLAMLEPIYQMSLGLQKQIMDGKGTLRLNIRDPFAWQEYKGTTKYDGIDMSFHSRNDFRQVTATFTYRFGKQNNQNAPRRRTSGSQEEQSRVGQ
jgi:iron complex outermembrane recepter protein